MLDSLQASFTSPILQLGLPPAPLFRFPPSSHPRSLPAPVGKRSWAQPFPISPEWYDKLLDVRVPVTVASIYAVTVFIFNSLNERRGYTPSAFSRTRIFKALVILHNILLAVYSAWTFLGMLLAFRSAMPAQNDPIGMVAVVDALCKITGLHGLGNGAIYDATTDQWVIPNSGSNLGRDQSLNLKDTGRLWNQGLAYFGWLFYLSKFYEVFDTVIILAKGKKSSTLQTYHHTGAMMCMWAGIRFMSQPIWLFILVNSGIHALMYSYYALTALSVRIPIAAKRALTTMQIMQFVIGSILAAIHLCIRYTIPVSLEDPLSVNLTQQSQRIAEDMLPVGAPSLRADAALTVNLSQTLDSTIPQIGIQYQMVHCVDTAGQAFAIWLNVMYLMPLTYLFMQFFVQSYLHRREPGGKKSGTQKQLAEKGRLDVLEGVNPDIQRIQRAVVEDGLIKCDDLSGVEGSRAVEDNRYKPCSSLARRGGRKIDL